MTSSPGGTTDEPLVSVVIPTRNRLSLLKQSVASVMVQTLSRSEVVVVDDASTDGTAEWLLAQPTERLTAIILEKNVERGAARNLGLEKSQAPFVLFLDDDDLLLSPRERIRRDCGNRRQFLFPPRVRRRYQVVAAETVQEATVGRRVGSLDDAATGHSLES